MKRPLRHVSRAREPHCVAPAHFSWEVTARRAQGRGEEGRGGGQPGAPVAYGDRGLCASAGANSLPALRPLRDTHSGRVHSVTDSTLAPQAAQLVLGATFAP